MLKRLIILTLLFLVPTPYLPLFFTGFSIDKAFTTYLLISVVLGFCVFIVNPVIMFLAIKNKNIAKPLFAFLIVLVAFYLLASYLPMLRVTDGALRLPFLNLLPIPHISVPISKNITLVLASLFMAIWGIIMDILL